MDYYFKERYVNLFTTFGFNLIFGNEDNKEFPIDFLNTLLPEHHQIHNLEFQKTLREPIRMKCQNKAGAYFMVELQQLNHKFFRNHPDYVEDFPIQRLILSAGLEPKIQAVYLIGLLNFIFDENKNTEQYLHQVDLPPTDGGHPLTSIYIELPKFKKSEDDVVSRLDKWLFIYQHLHELEEPPKFLARVKAEG
ncbi:MAG: PD-(D/E)XK nuclease family transposase [Cyanobacteria bacterium P01_G01_bin.54]